MWKFKIGSVLKINMTSKLEQPTNAEILDAVLGAIEGVKNDVKDIKDITKADILGVKNDVEDIKSEVEILDSIFELVDKMWQHDVFNFRNV